MRLGDVFDETIDVSTGEGGAASDGMEQLSASLSQRSCSRSSSASQIGLPVLMSNPLTLESSEQVKM